MVVTRSEPPTLLVSANKYRHVARTSAISDVRSYTSSASLPIEPLLAILHGKSPRVARIGCELGYEQRLQLPFRDFELLADAVRPSELVDAASLLWEMRVLKSPDEVACIKRAQEITAQAYLQIFAEVGAGNTEMDIRRRFATLMLEMGGDEPWAAITSGQGNYDFTGSGGTQRKVEPGDMVWLDGGCSVGGFFTDYSRACVIGTPTQAQQDAQLFVHELTMRAVRMVRPGVPVADIATVCREGLDELKLHPTVNLTEAAGRVGHGIGLDVTEPPHIAEYDKTILAQGMVVAIEPGFSTDYGIFHAEENVLVTSDGFELLTQSPWQLRAVPHQR
jgi:Xaa-Pro aminopeptidase